MEGHEGHQGGDDALQKGYNKTATTTNTTAAHTFN